MFRASKQLFGTSIVTVTNTKIVTQSTTMSVTCAKLVNVTGTCRRRRGMWAEEPIVISFDEDVDRNVQILFTPVLEYLHNSFIDYADFKNLNFNTIF